VFKDWTCFVHTMGYDVHRFMGSPMNAESDRGRHRAAGLSAGASAKADGFMPSVAL